MPLPAIAGGLLIGGLISLFAGKDKSHEGHYCQQAGQGSNHLLGTLGGAAGGAVLGSLVCPGLGTVIGGVLGGLFGREVSKQFSQDQCHPQPQHGGWPQCPPMNGGGGWMQPGMPMMMPVPQFGGFPQTGGYCCPPPQQQQHCCPQQYCPPQNCCPPQNNCPQGQPNWGGTLQQDGAGKPATYTTSGGYNVTMNGDRISITDPQGNKVEHWGDPHENVNGQHVKDWNEKTRTMILADGTKITMNATGPQGVTEHTSIYDGAQNIQFNNKNNTVEHRSFNPHDTAHREGHQADGETAYMGYAQNGDMIYRNIYSQNDNFQVTPIFQDLARSHNGGRTVDLINDPRLGHT